MTTVALPPGIYHIHPVASATTFSPVTAVSVPAAANEALTLDKITTPHVQPDQLWVFSGDGYLTSLGSNNFLASADEKSMSVKSAVSGTKFLISVTVQKNAPGFPGTIYTGTIRTPDRSFCYWMFGLSGGPVVLAMDASVGTNWAFVPVA